VTKFKYRLHDGAEYGNYGWVYIDVGNVKPWAVGESWVGKVGEFLSVPSLADRGDGWDLDSDDLTAEIVGAEPKNLTFNSDGSYTYTYINGHEEFTFRVFDGAEWSDPIPVHLQGYQSALNVDTPDVDNVNKAPVATDDGIYYANRNQTIHGAIPSLLFNDIDPDGDPLQFTSTVLSGTGPGGSAVTLDLNDTTGPLGFTGGEPGTYTYTYTITDGEFDSTANLTILVLNNAPYRD
ncbi:MAG: Ig-like domain-containing protein, partial [Boseongicola sp.]|nr:Ig-like domain-containing protein [Boseongicola sp.]